MISIEDVIRLTIDAHEGRKDLDGKPEILHPLAVGLAGNNREEVIAGFLHDVVEDSKLTFTDLRKKGVEDKVIIALKLLTHDKSKSTYEEYINKIALSGNTIAIHVKYNDLRNNLRRGLAGNHMKLNRASCGPRGHMKPGVVLSAFNIMGILPCFDRLYS